MQVVAGGLIRWDAEGFPVVNDSGGAADAADHARAVFDFACAMLHEASEHTYPHNGLPVKLRVGIHCGSIVSGVVGAHAAANGLV